ncbi:MAG: OmpH family outer membrane protein [Bacteroidales bacterium]
MFKKILIISLLALPFSAIAQEPVSQPRFATVKLQEIFQSMPETTDANAKLQVISKRYEDENLKMKEEFEKKYNDYVAQRDSLPENIRSRREQELQEINQRISNFMDVARKDIEQQQEKMVSPIQEKLVKTVKEVGAENDFIYILDENSVVFKGSKTEDITGIVKTRLGIK